MNTSCIEQILDDAVAMVALGFPVESCTDRWPAQRRELRPLLSVAQELIACAEESDELLHASRADYAVDWAGLLSDVSQVDGANNSARGAPTPTAQTCTQPGPTERATRVLRIAPHIRIIL